MQPTASVVADPELIGLVEHARNRYGRTGLLALVEICRQELTHPDPWVRQSPVGP